jgi:hypothetical protein
MGDFHHAQGELVASPVTIAVVIDRCWPMAVAHIFRPAAYLAITDVPIAYAP